jgi:two-component system, NtrC family, response regulator HupR/HoxA
MVSNTVLFVDDDKCILSSLRRGLLEEAYNKLFAESGKQALSLLEQNEVHVLVTDMRMPEMSGLELLKIVKEKYPSTIRMILSGYTEINTLLTAINEGEIYRFITKPWQMELEFKPAVRQAIEFYNFHKGNISAEDKLVGKNSI